jgi:hypothetical protein
MNSFSAKHQKWHSLPSVADISVKLPVSFTDDLLTFGNKSTKWLTEPNSLSVESIANLKILSSQWKSKLVKAPGALRLQLESDYSNDELRLLYAQVSRSLGYLNNRYTYFFDVQDRGLDYTKEAIPVSKTKAETGYHTDSTSKNYFPDYVGLLCLQPAVEGGESLVTNAANLLEFLNENHPNLNALLNQHLYRDVITPGTVQNLEAIRNNDIPLFQFDSEGGVIFRYMRYWIESALLKLNEPAPTHLLEALNTIDDFFARPENAMCFRLERGDMLFVNNRFLCHNRTAFIDGEKPRVYVRAWINESEQE